MRKLCVLTPYPIPATLAARKVPNIGDGLILRSVERLFGPVAPEAVFSPRVPPSPDEEAVLRSSDLILLAGANQLNDRYRIWPDLTAEEIRSNGYRMLPVGIGLHGDGSAIRDMEPETRAVLRAIHERIRYSSWRCPLTVAYLQAAMPELKERFLMTGCPVIFDKPLLERRHFHAGADHVAVTVTERQDGWFDRELSTLNAVQRKFPKAKRTLVLHQDFRLLASPLKPKLLDQTRENLHGLARAMGYQLCVPADVGEATRFYQTVDMHFGSRLHAHLFMLSQNRKSFVTAFDDRTRGLAMAFGFPLLQPTRLDEALDFDFERVRQKALTVYETMSRFIDSIDQPTNPAPLMQQ